MGKALILLAVLSGSLNAQLIIYDGSPQARGYPALTAELIGYLEKGYYEMSLGRYRIKVFFGPEIDSMQTDHHGEPIDLRAMTRGQPMYRRGEIRFDLRDMVAQPPSERCETVIHELFHIQDGWIGRILGYLLLYVPALTRPVSDLRELLATDVARMRIWRHVCP